MDDLVFITIFKLYSMYVMKSWVWGLCAIAIRNSTVLLIALKLQREFLIKQFQRYAWMYRNTRIIILSLNLGGPEYINNTFCIIKFLQITNSCYSDQKNNFQNDWLRLQILKTGQVMLSAFDVAKLKPKICEV